MPGEVELMRRCLGCTVLYQCDPTVYAVESSKDAKWNFIMCGKCDGKVWYVSNNGASCVSCWKCRHVNAVIDDAPAAAPLTTRPVQAVTTKSPGVFKKALGGLFGTSGKTEPKPVNAKSEGLCRSCTYKMSGLEDDDIVRRAAPPGEDKDYSESHKCPPSPTSLEAMVNVIRSTEWCMRQETDLTESQSRQLIISFKNKTISEFEFRTKLSSLELKNEPPVIPTSPSTSCASDKDVSDSHQSHVLGHENPHEENNDKDSSLPSSKVNTAIESNTPEQCEMSPMRQVPKMEIEQQQEEDKEEDDEKDVAEQKPADDDSPPASKDNTAIESNTPEQCEMSPAREVPKMEVEDDTDRDVAEQSPAEDDDSPPAAKDNTAIQSNTPEQCEMSPTREVPKMQVEEEDGEKDVAEQKPIEDEKPADDDSPPASKDNTAIESNTPEQCEMSPAREVPKMEIEDDTDKDVAEHEDDESAPAAKDNTAIESNTPEQCEMSPTREVPKMKESDEQVNHSDDVEQKDEKIPKTDDQDNDDKDEADPHAIQSEEGLNQVRINTAIESNTPNEAELSPLRSVVDVEYVISLCHCLGLL